MARMSDRERLSTRRALSREVPSTVAVLTDEADFAALRRYPSFTFEDYPSYLQQMEGLLHSLAGRGTHARIARFDPAEYERFCADERMDPDAADSRARYTAQIAAAGATVEYDGQPIDRLVPLLLDLAERERTWERAARLLAGLGTCDCCGQDITSAASDRAADAMTGLIEAAGPGRHHLVCSVTPADGPAEPPLAAVLHTELDASGELRLIEAEAVVLTTVLAAGMASQSPGGIVLRTSRDGREAVRGWQLREGWPLPLSEAEIFTAYCTDATTGEPVPPEPGVDYLPGFDLPRPKEDTDH